MSKKLFKTLRGFRVYLLAPKFTSESVYMTEQTKKTLAKDRLKELRKLTVYAVGESVGDLKEGDEVLVGDIALSNAPIIELNDEISVILINANDVVHIW